MSRTGQAHPMLQPSSWGDEDHPDHVALNLPRDRAAIYQIIWNSSLACVMRPPELKHVRTVWPTHQGVSIVAASLQAVPGKEGFWLYRQDFPLMRWPASQNPPALVSMLLEGVSLHKPIGPSPGQMIQGIFDAGITTPASISSLVSSLLGKDMSSPNGPHPGALVKFEKLQNGFAALLTTDGAELVEVWRTAGLLYRVGSRNKTVSAVEQGVLHPRDALHQLISGSPKLAPVADLVARQIDALCERWRGMSCEDGMREKAKLAHKPPVLNALPKWIDPETLLPANHSLRQWRERMESDIAMSEPAWSITDSAQRAHRRLQWLREHAGQIVLEGGGEEFSAAMDPKTGRFSALRYWLTGVETGREILGSAVKPEAKVCLGEALAAMSCDIGLTNEDFEVVD